MTAPDLEYVDPAETARYNVAQDASDTLDAYAERITNDLADLLFRTGGGANDPKPPRGNSRVLR